MLLPEFSELLDRVAVVSLPLVTSFRGLTEREAMLLRGPAGWTEFAPFVEYDDGESAEWLRAAVEYGWDTRLEPTAEAVRVNATVPAVDAADVPAVLARFAGCRTAKIKVAAGSLADETARVAAVRTALGAEGRIRIDANGGWNVDEAEHAIRALAQFDLDYVEQPCASVAELTELRERVADLGVDIAADESVRRSADPLAVARAGAADVLVIKAAPLGGVTRAEALVSEAGLPAVVSSALESAVGLGMGAMLASRLGHLGNGVPADAGLGTAALFSDDVAHRMPVDGWVSTARVQPDEAAMVRLAASPDRAQWWRDRLRRCYDVLATENEG